MGRGGTLTPHSQKLSKCSRISSRPSATRAAQLLTQPCSNTGGSMRSEKAAGSRDLRPAGTGFHQRGCQSPGQCNFPSVSLRSQGISVLGHPGMYSTCDHGPGKAHHRAEGAKLLPNSCDSPLLNSPVFVSTSRESPPCLHPPTHMSPGGEEVTRQQKAGSPLSFANKGRG